MRLAWFSGVVLAGVVVAVRIYNRRRAAVRTADEQMIDAAIHANGYSYRFEGEDEALRKQTEARRQHADDIKREARQIETRDDRVSKIHRVI